MFDDNVDNPEHSMIIWIIGQRGSGKTTLEMAIANKLLEDPKRSIALFQAPEMLLTAIKKEVPEQYKNRFRIVNRLYEVRNNDVIVVDEGLDLVNAKESLTVELRNLGKSLSYSRHKRIFLIICSVTKGVFKDLRDMADMKIYKKLTSHFVDSEKSSDSFVKNYRFDLPTLKIDQSLFISTYKYFDFEGGLIIGMDKCPWYSDKISKNMMDESFDSDFRKQQKIQEYIDDLIEEAIDIFGRDLERTFSQRRVRGWLQREYTHIYSDIEKYVPKIIDQAVYILYKRRKEEEEDEEEIEQEIKVKMLNPIIPKNDVCADFFRQFYKDNDPSDDGKLLQSVIYYCINGISQGQMARENPILSYNRVNRLVRKYNIGENLSEQKLRLFVVYEEWIAYITGGVRMGGIGEPDIVYYDEKDKDKVIGVAECKFFPTLVKNRIAVYQNSNPANSRSLNPSYEWCKKYHLDTYLLFIRVPFWGDFDICRSISYSKDFNEIVLERYTTAQQFIFNSSKFNQKQIFKKNLK